MKRKGENLKQRRKDEVEMMEIMRKSSIIVQTILNPCEDYEKVATTIKNIVDSEIEEKEIDSGKKMLIARGEGEKNIIKIFSQFRQRRILATVRRYLMKYMNKKMNEIRLFLHKQAAFNGVFSLCEPGESPLGEVIVKIRLENPEKVVKWLTAF